MSYCFDCFYFASNAKGRYCALNGQTVRRTDSCNAHFPKKNVQWCSMCNSRTTHDTGSWSAFPNPTITPASNPSTYHPINPSRKETDMTTKTTPFTIALWDSFPADKKPKAVTKSNRLVRILCTDRLGDYPIIGLIENRMPESWDPATSDLFLLIPSFPPSPDGQTCPDLASTNTNHEPQRPMAKKKKGKGGKKGGKRC